ELLGGLPDEIRHSEDLVDNDHGRGPLLALGIGQIRGDGVAAARHLHVLRVYVAGRTERWNRGQQHDRRHSLQIHGSPLGCTTPLPAYTPASADEPAGIRSRLRSASSAARSTSAVMSASMSASRCGATPRSFRYSSSRP